MFSLLLEYINIVTKITLFLFKYYVHFVFYKDIIVQFFENT